MKVYKVPVEYTMYGTVEVEAENPIDCIDKLKDSEFIDTIELPDDSEYVDGSFSICVDSNTETGLELFNCINDIDINLDSEGYLVIDI